MSLVIVSSFVHVPIASALVVVLGQTANNASTQTNSTDRKYLYRATTTTSGTITDGVARAWLSSAGTATSTLVIYSDSAGLPGNFLAQSDVKNFTSTTETAQTYIFSGANQITLASGTPYWIGEFHKDPGAMNFTYSRANTVGVLYSDPDTWSDGPADPCACATVSNGPLDLYINYTETVATSSSATSTDAGIIWFE